MSKQPPSSAQHKRKKRHPLLYQQRLFEQNFWPAVLTVGISAALLKWNPAKLEPYRLLLTIALICCGMVLVLTLLFRLRAYAICAEDGLRLRLPFYHLDIPYSEIKTVRPTELFRMYPPQEQTWTQRRFLEPLSDTTVLVIELDEFPERTAWLRLWMTKYMLCPDKVGLIVAVRAWMGFRAELDEALAKRRRLPR
jgi:hypothetical protein